MDSGVLSEIVRHVEGTYPEEGCGVVLERDGRTWVQPIRNAYDEHHRADPQRFPRNSRTAYCFDPNDWMSLLRRTEQDGTRIASIFHSHAEAGAYFSTEDSNMAAPDGLPLFPDIAYLVVSVIGGRAREARLFSWQGEGFVGERVAL
jgi:proteasome lid subunit RPN8/RPN11